MRLENYRVVQWIACCLWLAAAVVFPPGVLAAAKMPIPSQEEIEAIAAMLPPDAQGVGRPITDRAAWAEAAKQPAFQQEEKDAAKFLTEPDSQLPDALYNEVLTDGLRTPYEHAFRLRTTRLVAFVVAECIENQGKYLPAIETELDAILSEKSWAAPAHVLLAKPPPYGGLDASIDLAAAAHAWTLATTDYWLGDKLKPATRERIRDELRRRIFDGYEDAVKTGQAHWSWMTAGMNWNPVCTSGVVGAALALLPDPKERALFVQAAETSMRFYLAGFPDDGFDPEGLGYWNYGFGSYLCLAETLYQETQGRINLYAGAKVRQIALFPRHFEIVDGVFPAFGDSGVARAHGIDVAAGTDLMLLINERWGMGWTDLDPAKSHMYATHALGDRLAGFGLFGFPLPVFGGSVVVGSPPSADENTQGDLRFFFKPAHVLITRSTRPGEARLGLALKGGVNSGPHSHNDNGTYVAVVNGEALVLDAGSESYTAKSFGTHRYESMYMNSYGHDVPWVNRKMQKGGTAAKGEIVSADFTPDKDTVVIDLTSSYAVPALEKLTRTYVLDRTKPSIEIIDDATFSQPSDFGSALVTYSKWTDEGPGQFVISQGKAQARVTVTVDNGALVNKEEPLVGFLPVKPHAPERIGYNLAQPVAHVTMRTLIEPLTAIQD